MEVWAAVRRPAVTDDGRAASGQLRTVLKGLFHAELPVGPLFSHPTCCPALLSQERLLRATRVNFRAAHLHSPPVSNGVSFLRMQPATDVPLLLHTTALERVEDEDNDLFNRWGPVINWAWEHVGAQIKIETPQVCYSRSFSPWYPSEGSWAWLHMSIILGTFTSNISLYRFTFPPTVQKRSLFSTPSPAFIVCRLFDDGHSDWCEVLSHCRFDLHFSNNERCWASFHVFVSHLYVFFG